MIHLRQSGEWLQRERERSWREIEMLLQRRFMRQFQAAVPQGEREVLLTAVAERKVDPYTAVNQLLSKSASERFKGKSNNYDGIRRHQTICWFRLPGTGPTHRRLRQDSSERLGHCGIS